MPDTRKLVHRRPLLIFFALAFGLSWVLWSPLVVLRDEVPGAVRLILLLVGSMVPSVTAVVLTGLGQGSGGVRALLRGLLRWRVHVVWYLVLLVPAALAVLAVTISASLWGGPPAALGVPLLTALTMIAFSIFPGSAAGEEIGWRGFALPRLQSRRSALTASLLLGAAHALWHLPLWLQGLPSQPLSLYLPFVLQVIAYAVIYTWLYNSTRGSLLLIVLFHAATNAPLTLIVAPLGTEHLNSIFWLITGLTALWAGIVVALFGPSDLSRRPRSQFDDRALSDAPESGAAAVKFVR